MLRTVALVGRPNVGKSTLFNRLTRTRDALVADFPGLTRDRHYGRAFAGDMPYFVVDTGGFEPVATSGILHEMAKQTRQAIAESDVVVFLVDARNGLAPQDRTIAELLRKSGRPVVLAVNKAEGLQPERAVADFHELGLGEPIAISSAHGENVRAMIDIALDAIPESADFADDATRNTSEDPERPDTIKVAIVGRPNVGKSTLVNTIFGEERVIAFDEPGTTRDAIYLDFERDGQKYTLIDTAGVRRRGKVFEAIEKFSVIKTLQAIEDAHVVVLLLDAEHAITEQDAHLAGHILEAGRAVVVGINKWDAVASEQRDRGQARPRSQDGLPGLRRNALHVGPRRQGRRPAAQIGQPGVRRGHGQAADAAPDADAAARRGAAATAALRIGASEASLCAPGWGQPAAHRHPRHRAASRPRRLSPLSGTFLQRRVPTARNAA